MEHFLTRISTLTYHVENVINDEDQELRWPSRIKEATPIDYTSLEEEFCFETCAVIPDFELIEREEDTNVLIENTIELAANVTELAETHTALVLGRGQIL